MSIKKFLKDKLGKNYYKFRLKYILQKVFGNFYLTFRSLIKRFCNKFSFFKNNLNKKIEHQKEFVLSSVDNMEDLMYARGKYNAYKELLQDLNDLLKKENDLDDFNKT